MKEQTVDQEKLRIRLAKLKEEYEHYLLDVDAKYCENEAIYTSKFYKQYSQKMRGLIDVKKRFPWLVRVALNHTFTFIRLLQSKIVSNFPSVTAYPLSNEPSDKEASIAADNLLRYERIALKLDDIIPHYVLNCLIYGTAYMMVEWDANLGELVDIDENGEVIMEGDIRLSIVNPRNVYFDPNVNSWKDVSWVLIRKYMTVEEAKALYPESEDKIHDSPTQHLYNPMTAQAEQVKGYTCLYEYWERGMPSNGMRGRRIVTSETMAVLKEEENPYKPADLPIIIFTDIDIPQKVMGESIITLLKDPQKTLNRLFSQVIENANTHGVIRVAVSSGSSIPDDSITDRPMDIITYNGQGGQPPVQLQPANLPPYIFKAIDTIVNIMEHISGTRAFSRGEARPALSGFAYQFLQEQDEKVLFQVHNKYKQAVVEIYWKVLERIKQFWSEERSIAVLGTEREYEYYRYAGTSLVGRYNLQIQHGTSIPNDPAARRQAILELYKEGLIEDKSMVLRLLEIGDIVGVFDTAKFAKKRQKEEIDIMTKLQQPVPIREYEDHASHLQELYAFQQTKDYYDLDEQIKINVDQHTQEHETKMKELQGGAPQGAPQQGPPPITGNV